MQESMDAIVIRDVVKRFRKRTIRGEYTTFKSELLRWLRGQRQPEEARLITALRGINLTIPRGKTMGILGRNGSGKSTLLKLITGIYAPTSGTMEINGRISALLDLGAGFHPDFSGRENILINGIILGMSRAEVRERMDAIIAFSELGDFIDEPVRTYSSGMYMRLAFAVATHVDPDILIIDEILAVGDEHFSKKSLAKMTEFKKQGKTIVLVTHDLQTVSNWCDSAAWLDGGRIREVGEPAKVIRHYQQALRLAEAQGTPLTAPALSPGGGALPALQGSETSIATVSGTQEANAPLPVELVSVDLVAPTGETGVVVDTEQGLEVRVGFTTRRPLSDAGFAVDIRREDGTQVYATNTFLESVPLPEPLPEHGTVRFVIERVGLSPGRYTLDVSARSSQGTAYSNGLQPSTFEVRSPIGGEGLVRPPHRWIIEPGAVPQRSAAS
ncbi:ABC transporter ATP-binding protein [Archangium violaceum]|uniref:ABC transporter ATP-binding protein n=1 Tax=Archangium violaceum Cb vi76 TaxID=1406225 RepID=A0A084T1Q0_9BACT|nr:ABC transporter ATP-binding protein [Archangium violaceum]KFA94635.1 ABC transporter ATP-binding protein [Archangium violaceum Cb vi76]